MRKLLILTLIMFSASSYAASFECQNSESSSLPVKVLFEKKIFRNVKYVKSVYTDYDDEVSMEHIFCKTTDKITRCSAAQNSLLGKVIFHPIMGAFYTIKGEGRRVNWLECDKVSWW